MNETTGAALELRQVVRTFRQASAPLPVLRGASLALKPGEIVALVGPSGAGKSTLLHVAGLLERPDEGEVVIDGRACGTLSDLARTQMRRSTVGFVYQFHHLLPEFSALENVMLPQMIAGVAKRAARRARRSCWARLDWRRAPTIGPRASPAASSSASRSCARSPTRRACCWATSPPAISISTRRAT